MTCLVKLDAAPMLARLAGTGKPVLEMFPNEADRQALYRARKNGWVTDVAADRLLITATGLTLDEVYGPAWDDVGGVAS